MRNMKIIFKTNYTIVIISGKVKTLYSVLYSDVIALITNTAFSLV